MSEPIVASWSVELNVHCPNCNDYINLFDSFCEQEWNKSIEIGQAHDFEKDKDEFEVECSNCTFRFKVDGVEY